MFNKKLFLISAIVLILTSFVLAGVYQGYPGIPHQFYGSVMHDNQLINSGTLTTKIDNITVATTSISSGKYGYISIFFIEDPDYTFNGEKISFFVNGQEATTTYIFENGEITRLDIILGEYSGFCGNAVVDPGEECDDGELNGEKCDNSDSSCYYCDNNCNKIKLSKEGDNDDDDNDNSNNLFERLSASFCEPGWKCTGWSECDNDKMKRTCVDSNNCLISYNKPMEETGCTIVEQALEKPKPNVLIFILMLVITIGLIFFIFKILTRIK